MFWSVLADIATIITIVTLPYLFYSYRKRSPRFSFAFLGSARQGFSRDNMEFCRLTFEGAIRNQSLDPNSIEAIHWVVWTDKRKKGTRSFGGSPVSITENGQDRALPLSFQPRQARRVTIVFELPLTGSHDKHLVEALEPLPLNTTGAEPGTMYYLPKYTYELAFKDILDNLFDQDGLLRNQRGIDRRWTLDNTFAQLKDGHPLPFIRHSISIYVTDLVFALRRTVRKIGL